MLLRHTAVLGGHCTRKKSRRVRTARAYGMFDDGYGLISRSMNRWPSGIFGWMSTGTGLRAPRAKRLLTEDTYAVPVMPPTLPGVFWRSTRHPMPLLLVPAPKITLVMALTVPLPAQMWVGEILYTSQKYLKAVLISLQPPASSVVSAAPLSDLK